MPRFEGGRIVEYLDEEKKGRFSGGRPAQPEDQEKEQGPNIADRVLQKFDQIKQAKETIPDPTRSGMRQGALAAQAVGDVIGQAVSFATPDFIEDPLLQGLSAIGRGAYNLPIPFDERSIGQYIGQGYGAVKGAAPESVGMLEDISTIASLAMPNTKFGKGLSSGGKNIVKSSVKRIENKKTDYIKNIALPPITAQDVVKGRVEDTLFGRRVIPDSFQKNMIDEVANVKGLSPKKSIINNARLVAEKANKMADDLLNELEKSKVKFTSKGIDQGIQNTINDLLDIPDLVTEKADGSLGLKPSARTIINIYQKSIEKNPKTPAGLLKARRDFDKEMLARSSKVFDPSSENIRSIVTRELRTRTNDMIANYVNNIDVKKSLNSQHMLYSAAENMAKKGIKTAETPLGRFSENVLKKVPFKSDLAGLATIGGLGYAGAVSPLVAAGSLGAYGAYRAATSPVFSKYAGYGLQGLGSQVSPLEYARGTQAGLINLMNQEENQ